MDFTQWLQAKGIDPASLSLEARTALQSAWRAEQSQQAPPPAQQVPVPQATVQTPPPAAPTPSANGAGQTSFDAKMAAIEAENERVQFIQQAVTAACEANIGNAEKCKQLRQIGEAAIADRSTTRDQFRLAILQADRYNGPTILAPRGDGKEVTAEVLEAAICASHGLPNLDKRFTDQQLQAAHTRFRRGLGLKQLIYLAAQKNDSYRGDFMDEEAMCRAAFRPRGFDGPMSTVPSTIDVSGILSNVANKFLAESFLYTEQSWREIARIRSANDFKQISTYRLTSSLKFEKVGPGGEIKHGTLGETTYTNQVETYGKMIGISRTDIINDDLGAFTRMATELSRGAGDSLNEVFWTEWLDDSTFFPTDKSLDNYDDGATDSVLSLAGLENADAIFAAQTKEDGTPLGAMPAILLVPRGLRATALTLMSATGLVGQGFNAATVPDGNPWAGMFRVVSSIYLSSTAITGNSATAWYLLADPMNIAGIEVAFLFGRDTPIVESADFDFNRLGMSWRAYFDFGCNKQEYRCGVKLKGAA